MRYTRKAFEALCSKRGLRFEESRVSDERGHKFTFLIVVFPLEGGDEGEPVFSSLTPDPDHWRIAMQNVRLLNLEEG